ncbi:hypothetical protein DIPPA_70105 [Diplonema papillatum]|nr:hypothetical protein DIPPA_70105 [Diplonema papillatum]
MRQKRWVSRALRKHVAIEEKYYPREWFAQKENTELSMFTDARSWKNALVTGGVGKSMSASARRHIFWKMEERMRVVNKEKSEGSGMFFLPYLDWSLREGCKPFLSAVHAHALYSQIHRNHVEQLTKYCMGLPEEAAPLHAVISSSAFDATKAAIHFHACMHWNMLFSWKSIVPFGSVDMPVRIRRAVWKYFPDGGVEQLEKEFEAAAMKMVGNGFVWLLWNPTLKILEVRTTERHQCPFVLEMYPLVGLNIWDNAIAPGYELNKLEYVKRFWLCIDWYWADYCWSIVQEELQELSTDLHGRNSKKDVHMFPTMPSFREERYLQNRERGSREEPLRAKTSEWESWKVQRNNLDPVVFGPGMNLADQQDQEVEFQWKAAQSYHILSTHASLNVAYPTQCAGWDQTARWWSQLTAKAEVRRSAVYPPAAGIMWPEERHTNFLSLEADEWEEPDDWNEETPRVWKEMREKWFHMNTHEREFDFWRQRYLRATDKQGLYYGAVMGSG